MKIVFLVGNLFQDEELIYPYYRLLEAGHQVVVTTKDKEEVVGKAGHRVKGNLSFDDLKQESFDAAYVPGGFSPDYVRRDLNVLNFVRRLFKAGKPVGFFCHGPWVAVSAGILKGKKATSVSAIKDDMVNAGAKWVDEEVVVDGNLITSRKPSDLPAFMREFLKLMT